MKNLWAPWRMAYIGDIGKNDSSCFLCDAVAGDPVEHLVIWKNDLTFCVMNRFPYNNGHLLIAPIRHIADLTEATDEEMLDLMRLVRDTQRLLSMAISPHGFNVGINLGRCAGAGLPGHVHVHVVPRWNGDTNFVSVCSDIKVVSQGLAEMLEQLKETAKAMGSQKPG